MPTESTALDEAWNAVHIELEDLKTFTLNRMALVLRFLNARWGDVLPEGYEFVFDDGPEFRIITEKDEQWPPMS